MRSVYYFLIAVIALGLFSCTTYKTQYAGFRHPGEYNNSVTVGGATIGAEAFAEQAAAKEAFGFDIKKAGLLPVQVVMDNKGVNVYKVVTGQTFLVDNNNRYWNLIPNHSAVERVSKATEAGAILGGAGKGAGWGAASGAVLGAAFGILTGENVAKSAGKGAAAGAAGGAVYGGAQSGTDSGRKRTIADDIRTKGIEGKVIPQQSLVNGFLFFPAEAQSARELRVQIVSEKSGDIYTAILPF
jgi:hypothetical protein